MQGLTSSEQLDPALLLDRAEGALGQLRLRMRHGDQPFVRRVFEVMMAALRANLDPPGSVQFLYDVPAFHVYNDTH